MELLKEKVVPDVIKIRSILVNLLSGKTHVTEAEHVRHRAFLLTNNLVEKKQEDREIIEEVIEISEEAIEISDSDDKTEGESPQAKVESGNDGPGKTPSPKSGTRRRASPSSASGRRSRRKPKLPISSSPGDSGDEKEQTAKRPSVKELREKEKKQLEAQVDLQNKLIAKHEEEKEAHKRKFEAKQKQVRSLRNHIAELKKAYEDAITKYEHYRMVTESFVQLVNGRVNNSSDVSVHLSNLRDDPDYTMSRDVVLQTGKQELAQPPVGLNIDYDTDMSVGSCSVGSRLGQTIVTHSPLENGQSPANERTTETRDTSLAPIGAIDSPPLQENNASSAQSPANESTIETQETSLAPENQSEK